MNKNQQFHELLIKFQKTLSKEYDEFFDERDLIEDFFVWTTAQKHNFDQEKLLQVVIDYQERLTKEYEEKEKRDSYWWEGWGDERSAWRDLSAKFAKFSTGKL